MCDCVLYTRCERSFGYRSVSDVVVVTTMTDDTNESPATNSARHTLNWSDWVGFLKISLFTVVASLNTAGEDSMRTKIRRKLLAPSTF